MIESVIKPKEPKGSGWLKGHETPSFVTLGYPGRYWFYPEQGFTVISALEVVSDENDIDKGPEYHISMSKNGGRCSRNESRFICKAFDMLDAEEDNHTPGVVARNFWKPVATKFVGHICPCKDEETAMLENKGDYIWRGINK